MIYTELKYINFFESEEKESISCKINGVSFCSVPLDPQNSDYAEIMRLVDAGELTIEPADD